MPTGLMRGLSRTSMRNSDGDGSALPHLRIDPYVAGERTHALKNSAHPHPNAAASNSRQVYFGDTRSVIADFHYNVGAIAGDAYIRGFASRVPVYVRQTFLNHAEDRQLHVFRQPFKLSNRQVNFNPNALLQSLHVPGQRGAQAQFV